jgi:hypothetical protein
MNTKKKVVKVKNDEFVLLNSCYVEDEKGNFDCSDLEFYLSEVVQHATLTYDEKLACASFSKAMDKKYGKRNPYPRFLFPAGYKKKV